MQALSLRNLRKTYKSGLQALKGIDLDVASGDFFALLGPNGAGKSTTIGILCSLVTKTSGQVSVFGHDLDRNPHEVRRAIGLVPQEINFNQFEKVINIVGRVLRHWSAQGSGSGRTGVDRTGAVGAAQHHVAAAFRWHEAASDDCPGTGTRTPVAHTG